MYNTNLRLAWRNLRKSKLISAINIFGLATGLAAALLMMLWVQNEMSYDSGYKDYRRSYLLVNNKYPIGGEPISHDQISYILGEQAAAQSPAIEKLTRTKSFDDTKVLKTGNRSFYELNAAYVDHNWFEIFDRDIVSGELASFYNNPFSIVLTQSRAKNLFGKDDAVGKIITIDSADYMVRAVVADNKTNNSFQFEMMLPVAAALTDSTNKAESYSWNRSGCLTFVKLKENADTSKVASTITSIRAKNWDNKNFGPEITSLMRVDKMHFEMKTGVSGYFNGNKQTVVVFGLLAALVLVSACINYVNLTTARAMQRSKEVGIRKLIGARRVQIFMQFLAESVLITGLAILIALAAVQLILPSFNDLTAKNFMLPLFESRFWLIVLITGVIVIGLNGVYPAMLISSFQPVNVLKGNGLFKLKDGWLRKALVVVQFSFSIALIAGTIILIKQLKYINERDGGFNRSLVFQLPVPNAAFDNMNNAQQESKMQQVRASLAADAAVKTASVATPGIGNTGVFFSGAVDWPGKPSTVDPNVSPFWADDHFFKFFDLKLAEGRWLNNDLTDINNMVINESAVTEFGLQFPITGKRIVYLGDTGVIVGVVKDLQYKSMHEKIGAQVFKQNNNAATFNLYVKPGAGRTTAALDAARKVWSENFPAFPFNYSFIEDDYAAMYAEETRAARLVTVFSIIAVSISCLGLLGLATFATQTRAKEISIRKVLGASALNILNLLSKDFMKLVMISAIVALPVAWYFGNMWLQKFAYRIDLGWMIFAATVLIALLVAFATISVHAIKAAVANPALRDD